MENIPNTSTKIELSEIKSELETPFIEKNKKEFYEKKAKLLAELNAKLKLTKAQDVDYRNVELNAYQKVKKYLNKHYDLKYDIVANNVYYSKKGANQFSVLHELALQNELYEYGLTKFNDKLDAVLQSEITEKADIFVDYFFHNLPEWTPDKPDYIGQLCSYIETTEPELFKLHLRKHLIRSVACSLTHIDFNKHCLVFYGKQNDGKSYLVRYLAGGLPIKENLDMQTKDSLFALAKYFIINLDEMQGLQKTDVNKIKDYISKSRITARVIYQKKDSDFPRRATFYGTTNEEDILTDTTGNVRFLIFEVLGIKHDNGNGYEKHIDIKNVYAQAFYYMVMGTKSDYELNKEELAVMDKINKRFLTPTPEMDMVLKYFTPCSEKDEKAKYMTNEEIATYIGKECKSRIGTKRLGQALKFHGFERVKNKSLWKYVLLINNGDNSLF